MSRLTVAQADALRHAARSNDGRVPVVADPRATWAARRGTVVALHHRGLMEAVERMDYGGEGRPCQRVKAGVITAAGLTALIEHDHIEALREHRSHDDRDGAYYSTAIPHPADRTPRDWWLLGWRSAARYNFPDEDMAREHWPPDAAEPQIPRGLDWPR